MVPCTNVRVSPLSFLQKPGHLTIPDMHPTSFIKMDDESYEKLRSYVTREYGIRLTVSKKSMVESRLNKKVKSLGFDNYKAFLNFIFSNKGKNTELLNVIDLITTNKTDFFREFTHFQYLTEKFLPEYVKEYGYRCLKIWSVGCSTGEEPYTLLMTLENFKKNHVAFNYSILASDISIRALQTAYQGIYSSHRIAKIADHMKRAYFLKSNQKESNLVRVKPHYRKKITYQRINLLEHSYGTHLQNMDLIFCRNVLIYFDKRVQENVVGKLSKCLRPEGLLFLGHSESLMGMNVPLKQVKPTIYQSNEL